MRICEYVRGAGKTTLRVGSTAGQCNTAWSFQQRLPIPAIPKARSSAVAKDEQRFADTDQQRASPGKYPRFNSVNGWIVYECDSEQWWERLTVGRICKGVRRAGRTTVGVGSTAGISTETPDTGNPEGAIWRRSMTRGSRTRINNVRHRESIRGSTQSTAGYSTRETGGCA